MRGEEIKALVSTMMQRTTARKASEAAAAEAVKKAESAMAKVDMVPKLVKQVIASKDFLLVMIITVLGAVGASVAISFGLSLLAP